MKIPVDGTTMNIPDGTTATFVDPDGNILLVGRVDGDQFRDLTKESGPSIDCEKERHTEVETVALAVPASASGAQSRSVQAVRICRNQFGNIVKCPPR